CRGIRTDAEEHLRILVSGPAAPIAIVPGEHGGLVGRVALPHVRSGPDSAPTLEPVARLVVGLGTHDEAAPASACNEIDWRWRLEMEADGHRVNDLDAADRVPDIGGTLADFLLAI